jgi:rSAM/selenodomain-associated transferase 1
MMFNTVVLAKAPVAGRVKTRLGADVGMAEAAALAAASLRDTLAACAAAAGADRCHLALDGDLADATGAAEIEALLGGWTIRPQVEGDLGDRIAGAVGEVAGPVVQVGMDTPQLDADLLREVAAGLEAHDAVLGEAEDGGWWVLALRDPVAAVALRGVPMSTPTTYDDTLAALVGAGLDVGTAPLLRDVDTVADADVVAALAPRTAFAAAWNRTGSTHAGSTHAGTTHAGSTHAGSTHDRTASR